jgi:4'-phosphopantetheinyl transferase EntD
MCDLARLTAVARELLPAGVSVAAADPAADRPDDPETPVRAVERRRREFAAGRAAARMAMADLGWLPASLPVAPDRRPVWPQGLIGSITHTASAALAAVAVCGPLRLLGLDLEKDRPLDAALWPTVLLSFERAWAGGQSEPGAAAMTVFCAKEAAYKAQYPRSLQLFGFDAMSVAVADGAFTARFEVDAPPFRAGDTLSGRLARAEGHILAAVSG